MKTGVVPSRRLRGCEAEVNRNAGTSILLSALLGCASPAATASQWSLWQFVPPPGEPIERPEVRAWQRVEGRSFCQFALYAPMASSGDVQDDFAAEWGQLARARGVASPAPAPLVAAAANGWTRSEATGEERGAAAGRYTVRQLSFSGHGQRMSAVVTGNDAALCATSGEAFLASLLPLPPRAAAAPVTTSVPAAAGPEVAPSITAQTWMKTAASYSHWGSNFSLGELAKLSRGQGYARRSWQFGTDGRYRFRVEVWSMTYKPNEVSGIEDTGRWRMEGDRVIVEPESAVAYVEDKQTRRRLHEQPAKTAPTVYRGRMHWLSGMGAWYLVLAPQDGRPTLREGDFDNQPGFPNAYFYGPPPRVGG